jgi:hypothetical protein
MGSWGSLRGLVRELGGAGLLGWGSSWELGLQSGLVLTVVKSREQLTRELYGGGAYKDLGALEQRKAQAPESPGSPGSWARESQRPEDPEDPETRSPGCSPSSFAATPAPSFSRDFK